MRTLAPALAMLAALALAGGGIWLLIRTNERLKAALMLICAAVLLANVLIWTW